VQMEAGKRVQTDREWTDDEERDPDGESDRQGIDAQESTIDQPASSLQVWTGSYHPSIMQFKGQRSLGRQRRCFVIPDRLTGLRRAPPGNRYA
jgi:hypothetical protein